MSTAPSIFISYSTLDDEVARMVRNLFEQRGHDALLLLLKQQMSDDSLMDFLRNEVKARDWVVMIDSQHAEHSNWVSFERAVAGIYQKPVYHVNANCAGMSAEPGTQEACLRDQVQRISRRLRVFLSYSHLDRDIADRVADVLRKAGYALGADVDQPLGTDYLSAVQSAIDAALERGIMLVLISENSVHSRWVEAELTYGLSQATRVGGKLIPVLVPPKAALPVALAHIQAFDLTDDIDRGLDLFIHQLQQS